MNFKKLAIILFSALFIISGCGKKAEKAPTATPSATPAATEVSQNSTSPSPTATTIPEKTEAPQKTDAPATATTAPATPPPATPAPVSVNDKMNSILQGVETPRYEVMPIDAESFESYFFTPYVDGAKAVTADALISSTAHSVCLVSLPEGTNAQSFASKVKQNADPRKWICVEAESVQVAVRGNMVLLVMSDKKTADAIINNFNK